MTSALPPIGYFHNEETEEPIGMLNDLFGALHQYKDFVRFWDHIDADGQLTADLKDVVSKYTTRVIEAVAPPPHGVPASPKLVLLPLKRERPEDVQPKNDNKKAKPEEHDECNGCGECIISCDVCYHCTTCTHPICDDCVHECASCEEVVCDSCKPLCECGDNQVDVCKGCVDDLDWVDSHCPDCVAKFKECDECGEMVTEFKRFSCAGGIVLCFSCTH